MFQGGLIHAGGSDRTEFVYRAVCNGQAGASTSVPEGLIASSHLTRAQQNVLAWDGRLDNADELRNALAGSDYIHTEQELVLQLYLKFGLKSIGLLIGDFALSIWDQQRNTLLLARDAFGARPLYYRHHGREIVWASDLDVLVGWAGNVSAIDDEYIADYLTVPVRSDLTPYRGLRAVPPATSLVYSAATGTIELHEFWSPVSCAPVVYDSDLEYENHFLRVFEDAVRCRLRASGPVWIELSGGLDSSSIVCVAERLRHREKADLADYRTVSDVFPESKSSDETEYIKEVERSIGREGTYLQENDQRILDPIDEWVSLPGPLLAFGRRHLTLSAAMHALGSNILVKGVGGDQVLWSNWQACFDVADLFWTGRVGAFLKRIRDWHKCTGRTYWDLGWTSGVQPCLQLVTGTGNGAPAYLPNWLSPAILSSFSDTRGVESVSQFRTLLPSTRRQVVMVSKLQATISRGYYNWRGIIPVYPYTHRPLVEFCLGAPISQKIRPGENRSVMRRALRGIVPDLVLSRTTKRGPLEAACRALMRQGGALVRHLSKSEVVERGYVRKEQLLAGVSAAQTGRSSAIGDLLNVLCLERWLRALRDRPQHVPPPGNLDIQRLIVSVERR